MSTNNEDKLILGGHEFTSRFILGSGKFSLDLVKACIEKADAQIITLALRRANEGGLANILDYIPKNVTLLPNTSGARNAEEAVRIARLSREIGCGDFVKIEVIHDSKYLLPDNYETVKATEILAKEGFDLKITEFNDYVQPNLAVADGQLDCNFFQHLPYLESFVKDRGSDLVNVGGIHIEPMGVYSRKIKDLKDLKDKATVAIPNDPTNGGRALLLLQSAGLITLEDPKSVTSTPLDIKENKKNLNFKELEAPQLPRSLDDTYQWCEQLVLLRQHYPAYLFSWHLRQYRPK